MCCIKCLCIVFLYRSKKTTAGSNFHMMIKICTEFCAKLKSMTMQRRHMGLFMRHLKLLMKLNLFSSMNSYRTIAREGTTLFSTLSHLASSPLLFTRSGTGGQNLHFLWRVSHQKTQSDLLNEAHSIVKKMEKEFPVFHSRAIKQDFIQSFGRATGCKSAFLRAAYRRLTSDSSAASTTTEAEVDQRVSRILDEEDPDLI